MSEPPDDNLPFKDWLQYMDALDNAEPVASPATIRVFLDCPAPVASRIETVAPDSRTLTAYLEDVAKCIVHRTGALAGRLDQEEIQMVFRGFANVTVAYQHQNRLQAGLPLERCGLVPPCPYHPPTRL